MNPYQVLGVKETASMDEIRNAYLSLVKKYHPDKYANNPLQAQATEKLKEVNAAYEQIKRQRESASAGVGADYSTKTETSYTGDFDAELAQAEGYINANMLSSALEVLDRIGLHNARWHYLYGVIAYKQNLHSVAAQHFEQAYRMEPTNIEYKRVYDTVTHANVYSSRDVDTGGRGHSCSACDMCSTLICADCCCEAIGGDLIPCC